MKPLNFMLIAGEASGDANAAELVKVLAEMAPQSPETDEVQPLYASLRPSFFGAGGPKMAQAGVELAFDMTAESAIGVSDVLKKLLFYRRVFEQLLELALDRQPDVIVLVDFGEFNRRFAHTVKKIVRSRTGVFENWNPKIVQYVSPQVWASRSWRAAKLAKDIDLLLCLFPFEKEWYAKRLPDFQVVCVGHPLFDRHAGSGLPSILSGPRLQAPSGTDPVIALLPGSRKAELRRHMPVILEAARKIGIKHKVCFKMVLPSKDLEAQARQFDLAAVPNLQVQVGGLDKTLAEATVAVAKSGTVTHECAYFGVPTVVLYKDSWLTYQIGRRIVHVRFLTMANLLADEAVYPEFIQNEATPENIVREAVDLLTNKARRQEIQAKLRKIIDSLGGPGATQRSAQAIVRLLRAD